MSPEENRDYNSRLRTIISVLWSEPVPIGEAVHETKVALVIGPLNAVHLSVYPSQIRPLLEPAYDGWTIDAMIPCNPYGDEVIETRLWRGAGTGACAIEVVSYLFRAQLRSRVEAIDPGPNAQPSALEAIEAAHERAAEHHAAREAAESLDLQPPERDTVLAGLRLWAATIRAGFCVDHLETIVPFMDIAEAHARPGLSSEEVDALADRIAGYPEGDII